MQEKTFGGFHFLIQRESSPNDLKFGDIQGRTSLPEILKIYLQ
jgi:hypothetical protein